VTAMKKKQQAYAKKTNGICIFSPAITTIAFPLLFGKKVEADTRVLQEKSSNKFPDEKLTIEKYELSDIALKFFKAKGMLKKHWVLVIEIPISEIISIENLGDELTVTWKGSDYKFISKKKESFSSLVEQIRVLQEKQKKATETEKEVTQRKTELTELIHSSIDVVDLAFNIIMGLNRKRVDWVRLESYANGLESKHGSKELSQSHLVLDFAKIAAAIKKQDPKTASKETFAILKILFGHVNNLKLGDYKKDSDLMLNNVQAVILAYYVLNDLMLGKIVNDSEGDKEFFALENILSSLASESNFRISFDQLKLGVNKLSAVEEHGGIIEDTRAIFREQLKLF